MKNHERLEDDPRFTAYALGELDVAEAAAFETELAQDAQAQAELEELRALTARLASELEPRDAPELSSEQRATIVAALGTPKVRAARNWRRVAASFVGVAASVAFCAWVWRFAHPREEATPFAYNIFGGQRPEYRPARQSSSPDVEALRGLGYISSGSSKALTPTMTLGYVGPGTATELERARGYLVQTEAANTEGYDAIRDNPFVRVADAPLSTFSIDVDTASYANVRRFLTSGQLPPPDAVRIEELVNYFEYEYPPAQSREPFSVHAEVAACPWAPTHQLVKIGLQGRQPDARPKAMNLVFLVDVSGSMQSADKLELVKAGLRLLVPSLGSEDTVALAVYAGSSGLVLPATSDKGRILAALGSLTAGGSTNGAAGIELAYRQAAEHFIEGGINRVILCTDGDFNVGTTSEGDLQRLIEVKRQTGVFLSVMGFGTGNLQDAKMETLANNGNGVYYYIDSEREAEKVFVRDLRKTLETIAKDVKIQVEFNPAEVGSYRLIGYENRVLAAQDFNDDRKDAGEIGAGHTVTAFYEVVPRGVIDVSTAPPIDDLKYQPSETTAAPGLAPGLAPGVAAGLAPGELLTVKLRYKEPQADTSRKLEVPVRAAQREWTQTSEDFRFACGVALFGMCLRGSPYANGATLGSALELCTEGAGPDPYGDRTELLALVQRALELSDARALTLEPR